ncbi:acyltransferase [Streptomyces stelliscabiei]|uniref:Acetyltransferase-like isoleucine patch superfamily enzyme n=1 Tax=Streptomyces stelliscabiei TaxID=146820 RepID=A0A8I0TUT6_9ACTN|nr:acyltransferase [Streptomyces stelliscabiei]KND40294.1 acetyltransferase [Streptomyces stelliscabiei]MBE1601132.1 acetyltransferase-like isoleucine patch superfamily enzyme [Streptomyces stelliscabiei]MDX2517098.1 acyltransferase [Streptomyces stelliscabiei]MDX2554940.1 acyltransferase [Streptomyces stelliscabiei]MDX2611167.1 acyltransferase [Streptomyces stelliscabiei]
MDDHRQQPPAAHSDRFDHCPWLFEKEATAEQRAAQRGRQRLLGGDSEVGERCHVAGSAAVYPDRLRLGADSYIAAHAYVTGDLTTGTDCTLNPFTVVRGTVRLGSGVRIGAHTSLLGFNHSTAPDRPVFRQPLTSRGITVGDDVWIGSHVVVVDGVTVGDHCVIGAGAVVTKDLPAWSVAAGNPARRIRDRRETGGRGRSEQGMTGGRVADEALARFADTARAQAADIIARCWNGDHYTDRPGVAPTVRAHCDAVEIADLLLASVPEQLDRERHIERLAGLQDRETGLVPEFGDRPPRPDADGFVGEGPALYHVLSVGYALDLLGSSFPRPIGGVRDMTAPQLIARLEQLPWTDQAWGAGAWVDSWATAAHWNLRHPDATGLTPGTLDALFGWLLTRADPWTGMWGNPSAATGRLQVVNGYYRLTRGSFAQFGVPVPHPERVVDAVLDHARDTRHFGAGRENACNVLDVAHPLWLCTGQIGGQGASADGYRSAEIRGWAEQRLSAVLTRWQDGRGFGFGPGPAGPGPEPGLQGTEMWLAIVWLLADLQGRSDLLGYRPRGVHRPEPAPGA